MKLFILFVCFAVPSDGFSVPPTGRAEVRASELNMVDPIIVSGMMGDLSAGIVGDLTVAVGGAAVGYLSQLPRINSLQEQLDMAKAELAQETENMITKMSELEEKLFIMDRDFEDQTARFKKKYDMEAKARLEGTVQRIKADYQDRLLNRVQELKLKQEIEIDQEKSRLLLNSLDAIKTVSGPSQEEITKLRFQNSEMKDVTKKLTAAIEEANAEVERLRKAIEERDKRFFKFW